MIQSVRKACILHEGALSLQVSDAIVRFEEITGDPAAGEAFFETTFITEGLEKLLRDATRRLAGQSQSASFHLRQAMGGGKTHSITALSYLARHRALRERILQGLPEASAFDGVRFAAFNGRERPRNFFWGEIVEQLGASELLAPDVSDAPDLTVWKNVFGKTDDPVLIVLDEFPPYLEYLVTVPIGDGTMATRAGNAFANMLVAAQERRNVCIVVSDLEGAYATGSKIINKALDDVLGEIRRQQVDITPVSLEGNEGYEILRKRLIKQLPSENVIQAVAEAYARALAVASQAGLVDKNVERIEASIKGSYPFHPETKNLFAMFAQNVEFRQTRGLMELGSLLLRSVWESERDVYLIGAQHFDMSISDVRERLKDISRLSAAVAKDIFDTNESATAQSIDADQGNHSASEVAALLLTASLSTTGNDTRGLKVKDAMRVLVNPLGGEEAYKKAFDLMYKQAQYLHRDPEERYYFDRQVNLNVLLADFARNAPENKVNEIISNRLKELFAPTDRSAYAEILDGTEGIDTIADRIKGRRVLVAVRPDGRVPPQEVERFYQSVTEKNNVFILTGERSFQSNKLEDVARELYATIAAQRDINEANPQFGDLTARHQSAQQHLTATIAATYDRLLVPMQTPGSPPGLRAVGIQLTTGGGLSGERVVIEALTKPPRKLFSDVAGVDFDAILAKVESQGVWGTHPEVMYSDVERRTRENPTAYWLPPDGMKKLRDTAVQRERWEDLGNGRVSRVIRPKVPRVQVTVTKAPTATDHQVVLDVQAVNAGANARIHFAENGPATDKDELVKGGKVISNAVMVGLLIVDPSRPESPDVPNRSTERWQSVLPIAHKLVDEKGKPRLVELFAHPEASLRFTLDGTNPRDHGAPYVGPIEVDDAKQTLSALATITVGGALEFENKAEFLIPARTDTDNRDPWVSARANTRTTIECSNGRYAINTRANAYKALDVLHAGQIALFEVDLVVNRSDGGQATVQLRTAGEVKLRADALRALLDQAHALIGDENTTISLRFPRAIADNHTYLRDLDELLQERVRAGEVKQ